MALAYQMLGSDGHGILGTQRQAIQTHTFPVHSSKCDGNLTCWSTTSEVTVNDFSFHTVKKTKQEASDMRVKHKPLMVSL